MNVTKENQLNGHEAYDVAIEPIGNASVMGRYTHSLKVRYQGLAIDPGFSLYLEPIKELAVTDFHGTVAWYRSNHACYYKNGLLVRESIPFKLWLNRIIEACGALIFNDAS